jgi:hypothetical protein
LGKNSLIGNNGLLIRYGNSAGAAYYCFAGEELA